MRISTGHAASVMAIIALSVAGCAGDIVSRDTGAEDVADDVSVPDQGGEDAGSDVYVFPDMGGNGIVSVTLPSAELALRITTPSNRGYYAAQAGTVALAGLYFGHIESFHFEMAGENNGSVTWTDDSPYWQTAVIHLNPGENRIKVVATGRGDRDDPDEAAVQVSDEIVLTYNPNMHFPNPMRMSPPTVFVGRNQPVLAKINMGLFGQVVGDRMYVVRQNADGTTGASLGSMLDMGMVNGSSDEIQGDGIFTARVMVACDQAGVQLYRAAVEVTTATGTYTAMSAPFQLMCINAIDTEICTEHLDTLTKARKAFYAKVDAGLPDEATAAAYKVLSADVAVAETSAGDDSGGGMWVRFEDGVMGALNLFEPGTRGGGDDWTNRIARVGNVGTIDPDQIISRETLLMSPFFTEFGHSDEIQQVSEIVSGIDCPVFTLKGPYNGSGSSLEKFRQLSTSGIIAISTHSNVYFKGLSKTGRAAMPWRHAGGQEILWSGESVNCGRISSSDQVCKSSSDCPAGSSCIITEPPESYVEDETTKYTAPEGLCYDTTHADLMTGRIVLGDRTWGVTPEFVEYYSDEQRMPGSLVYLGGCRTLYNGSLAMAFLSSGARTVLGYSNRVSSDFAYRSGYDFFFNFLMRTWTTSESFAGGDADPDNPGSFFRLFGALDLSAKDSQILNPGFETSDASAWVTSGDGRVIPRLGATEPISGKFMGIISTGLGFTESKGKISQSFCIPAGASELEFYWKYYSEEFIEFCGTAYQDAFVATITTKDGTEYPVVDIKVDDLCPPDAASTPQELCYQDESQSCGDVGCTKCKDYCAEAVCGTSFVGLEKSDIQFDRGNTFMTTWQKSVFSLDGFDKEKHTPVTISFYCTDKGDSIFDTAVLVDSVSFR